MIIIGKSQKEEKKTNEITDRVLYFVDNELRKSTDPSICPFCEEHRNPNAYGWYCIKCKQQYPRKDLDHVK